MCICTVNFLVLGGVELPGSLPKVSPRFRSLIHLLVPEFLDLQETLATKKNKVSGLQVSGGATGGGYLSVGGLSLSSFVEPSGRVSYTLISAARVICSIGTSVDVLASSSITQFNSIHSSNQSKKKQKQKKLGMKLE